MAGPLPAGHVDGADPWYADGDPGRPRRPKGRLLVLLAILLAGGLGSWLLSDGPNRPGYIAGPGQLHVQPPADRPPAPRLRGELLSGARFNSADWSGDVIVVNFWGSWCPPCRAETPELVRSANAWRSSGVRFLGVDVRDERSAARAFVRQYDVPYPSLFDDDGTVTLAFRNVPPNAVPATFVFDREGRVAASAFGRVTFTDLTTVLERVTRE